MHFFYVHSHQKFAKDVSRFHLHKYDLQSVSLVFYLNKTRGKKKNENGLKILLCYDRLRKKSEA